MYSFSWFCWVFFFRWIRGCFLLFWCRFGGAVGLFVGSSLLENGLVGISFSFMVFVFLFWGNKFKWLLEIKVILLSKELWLFREEVEDDVESKLTGRSLLESFMVFRFWELEGLVVVLGFGIFVIVVGVLRRNWCVFTFMENK